MYPFSARRLAQGLGGQLIQEGRPRSFESLSKDSRKLRSGDIYLALKGEHFDGEAFYEQARRAGAKALVGPRVPKFKGLTSIRVRDSLQALQSLARDQRQLFEGPVIAITGSNGKTGVKDCLSELLGPEETLSTPGNWNNHIGLPLTLLSAQKGQRAAVLELGMNHRGELLDLGAIARPNVAIELNVGDAHLGFFRTREAVAKAKEELLEAMGPSGIAVLNGDDPLVGAMGRRFSGRRLFFGMERNNDLRLRLLWDRGVQGALGELQFGSKRARLRLAMGGRARAYQALASIAGAMAIGRDWKESLARYEAFRPQGRLRQEIQNWKGMHLILDAYNASPQSMSAALELLSLSAAKSQRLGILGEMLELGAASEKLHTALGREAKARGLRALACVGPHGEAMAKAFGKGGRAFAKDAIEEIARWLKEEGRVGDWVLFKASRGMALERIYQRLRERG